MKRLLGISLVPLSKRPRTKDDDEDEKDSGMTLEQALDRYPNCRAPFGRTTLTKWRWATHNASFDWILGIIVPRRGGVTGYYKPVHESLVFPGEIIVKRGEIVMPLFLGPGADNRRREIPLFSTQASAN